MIEKFYRDSTGKIIFNAIPSVGISNDVACSKVVNHKDYGFPLNAPSHINNDTVWADLKK